MKKTNKPVALILAVLMLVGATVAYADSSVNDLNPPSISIPAAEEQPESKATPAPEAVEAPAPANEPVNEEPKADITPAPEAGEELTPVEGQPEAEITPAPEETAPAEEAQDELPEVTPVPEQTAPAEEVLETEAPESENDAVNIHAAASVDSEIIGQLGDNDQVDVLDVEGDWTKIRDNGLVGYVQSAHLNIISQPESEEQTEVAPAVEQRISLSASRDISQLLPGDVLVLTATLSGFEGVNYSLNWQAKYPGDSWTNIEGASGATLTINITEAHNGCSWRLQVSSNG